MFSRLYLFSASVSKKNVTGNVSDPIVLLTVTTIHHGYINSFSNYGYTLKNTMDNLPMPCLSLPIQLILYN